MKTIKNTLAVLLVSLFLFACEAEMIEEVSTVETTDLTLESKQSDDKLNPKQEGNSPAQQKNDGDDDVPDPDEGGNDGDDDVPDPDEGGNDGDDDVPDPDEGGNDGDDDVPDPDEEGGNDGDDDVPDPDTEL